MKKRQPILILILNVVIIINLISSSFASISLGTIFSDSDFNAIPEPSDVQLLSPSLEIIFKDYTDQMFYFSSPAIDSDGNIFIGTSHKTMWFADGNSWAEHYFLYSFKPGPYFGFRWRYDVGPNIITGGPVINSQGLIFFVASGYNITTGQWPINSNLYALNSDGSLNWTQPISTDIENSIWWSNDPGYPSLDKMGNVYVHGVNYYYSFHWNNGTIRWQKDSDGYPGSPSVLNDTVYFPGEGLAAYYLNGTSKWNYTSSDVSIKHKISFGSDGTIYFGSESHTLYAINPDGTLKWSLILTDGRVRASPSIDREGILYVGTKHDTLSELFAIYPNGTIKWRKTPFQDLYSTPALGSDNRLYLGAEGQKLHIINRVNGEIIQTMSLVSDVTWCSPVISDGYILVGDMVGNLYALQEENLELSNEQWPCMGGNPQRTGLGDDLRPPSIMRVNHTPSSPNNETEITIFADAIDSSGIQSITCFYRVNSGTWSSNQMNNIQIDTYQTKIGYYNNGDEIEYYIESYDNSLNSNYYKDDNSSNYYRITIESETAPETNTASMGSFYYFCTYVLFVSVVLKSCKTNFRRKNKLK
ncbi:MAG: outer membrane protein assembly factor BamB family protein [Candidatus Heimdallarchaeaceae archaeon]